VSKEAVNHWAVLVLVFLDLEYGMDKILSAAKAGDEKKEGLDSFVIDLWYHALNMREISTDALEDSNDRCHEWTNPRRATYSKDKVRAPVFLSDAVCFLPDPEAHHMATGDCASHAQLAALPLSPGHGPGIQTTWYPGECVQGREMMCVFWSRVWLVFKGLSWVEDDLSYAVVRPWLMDKIKWMATLAKVRALREPTGHSCSCDQGSRGVAMGIRGTAHG